MNAVTRRVRRAGRGTLLAGNLGAAGLPTSHGFELAFAMCLVALGFALSVPRRRRPTEAAPAPVMHRPARGEPDRIAA